MISYRDRYHRRHVKALDRIVDERPFVEPDEVAEADYSTSAMTWEQREDEAKNGRRHE